MAGLVSVRMLLAALTGWLNHRQLEAIAYLVEENRILRDQLRGRRFRLTGDERRLLAVRGKRLESRDRPVNGVELIQRFPTLLFEHAYDPIQCDHCHLDAALQWV